MQIVIDIPDEQIKKCLEESKYILEDEGEKGGVDIILLYTNQKLEFVDISRKTDFYSLTDRYTVLPKGHGRLIDADALESRMKIGYRIVRNAETIIEADKVGSEEHTCSECIIKDTDACARGNAEADEVACEDFVGGDTDAE